MAEKFKNLLSNKRTYVLAGIILLLFAGGILLSKSLQPGGLTPGDATSIPVINDPNVLPSTEQDDKYGIHVKLSDGQSQPDTVEVLPLSTGEPLSPEEIEIILSRLPALSPAPGQQTEFNLPPEVLPPPRPGNTIEESFPPIETAPTPGVVDAGALQVLRFAPEGEIPIAPFVSVTFNQPMVPIGTLGDLAAKDVPVQVEPFLPGTWRWLGTETLTFEYDSELIDRLPKATEYRLTVPAGVKSATGEILAESVTWTFKTPPPKIVTTYPDGSPQPLEPIFFIAFDQRIDPAAVLKNIQVQSGSQSVNIALAAQADLDNDERVSQLVKDTPEGRWLAFRATSPFSTETNITVTIAAGTPSAEGPLTTTEAQSFTFSTYAPLRIEEHRCSWYDDSCPPLSPFYVRFNNPLDMNVFSEEMLHGEPEIPGVSANVYSNSIEISGETKGQTTYTVMDVNRQAWSRTTTLLVHPADLYIGLRSDRYFVERGTPLKMDFIVTDLDGNPIDDRPVEITAGRLEWKFKNGDWVEEVADVQTCSILSAPEPDTCSFDTPIGGSYQITAIVTDELGRKNQSRMTRWVSGGQQPPSRKVEQEKVTLIPDKETYQPGDNAQILVQSPFSPAEGMLTVSRSGILYTTRFKIDNGTATLNISIEEEHIPNLNIQVDLVGSAPRVDDNGEQIENMLPRPAYASGQLNLKIPPQQRTLSLQVTPDQNKLEPGGETMLTVMVKDAHGLPVSDAELAVIAVDEAILVLTNYQLSDPLSIFYTDRQSYLASTYSRANIILVDPKSLAQQAGQALLMARDGMGGAAVTEAAATEAPAAAEEPGQNESQNQQASINVRSDFNPLAAFAPAVRTGPNGEARVFIQLPDNLTRYRIMVVAVNENGNQFGTGESNLTARLPLMVRPSAPRFLNFGDKFELPVALQNQTDLPMTVNVVVRATNLELKNNGLSVTIPANDRMEVRFPAATVMAGTAHVQIAAISGDYADAASVEMPVYTPATSEAFATYGVIDEGIIAQPVQYPSDVFPQFGGLEINTSSTALQALTDAVLYLCKYPYEGSEQLASRVLAISSLRDVLTAFKADELPSPAEMESIVSTDIERLQGLQNADGGFPYWRRGFESIPFNTIHLTHALFLAQEKGFDVPAEIQQNSLNYLRDIESHYPDWYSQETRWTLSAYALHVRNLLGDRDAQKAQKLLSDAGLENLSMEAIGWLWPVIDDHAQLDAIRLFVNNHVVETAGAANFTTEYSDQTYLLLSSDRRTDAILLDALIEDNPQSDLIPKLVNGLLAHRTKGRWSNTQENVFVLLTLDRYFNTYETQTPDFVARIWLGNTYAGDNEFTGRTTDIYETLIPMNYVLSETSAGGTENLILSKDGPGRLYYRLSLQYAPNDLNLDPLDMGFVVQRRYEGLDNPEDVYQDSDGIWHIKAGARVEVKITMMADNRRYHVALVDPLPAGLEIVNPALAVSEIIPQDPTSPDYRYGWWWWGPWYEHQNMYDDRAEAFTSLLWDGVYEYTYIARATTPGTFIVPPTKAEEIYSPEVFGRSGSDWVIVEME